MIKHSLNFGWKFLPEFDEKHLTSDASEKGFKTVDIPHTVKELPFNNFDEEMYQLVSVYRKRITVTEAQLKKSLYLQFDAAANFAEVFINGEFAFSHKGGYTAFGAEINAFLKQGENVIAVKLDSTERAEIPPFGGQVDYLVYGGIYREVWLIEREPLHVKAVRAHGTDVLTNPKLQVEVELNRPAESVVCDIKLTDNKGFEVASIGVNIDNSTTSKITLITPGVTLWDIDNPALYTLTCKIRNSNDEVTARIGFRHAEFKKNGFFLNGKNVKIRGLNRHQSYPYVGYAMPASAQRADADYMKFGLGLNLARTSHYPQSHHFLDRCDEIGLLVFTEIPGWQHISALKEWRQKTVEHVEEMVLQWYNHPSIILWGVRINESPDDDELYKTTNELCRRLDPSRQTGGVRFVPFSKVYEDVFTRNDFTHSGANRGLWPKWLSSAKGRPYLVTEYNGHMFPTKTFDGAKHRKDHALRHAKVLSDTYKKKGVSGAIGWCMSDYNTHKDFGSGDKICYHGVSDMFRMDKLAAAVYSSQQSENPVLVCTSNMEIGDYAASRKERAWLITNCDGVKIYKNEEYLYTLDITAAAKKSPYKHLPHPPVPVDDLIGEQFVEKEGFSKGKARTFKKIMISMTKHGFVKGAVRRLPSCIKLLLFYRMPLMKIGELYGKYAALWGGKATNYRFEGLKDGAVVATHISGSVFQPRLEVKADSAVLCEGDTYDVTRVTCRALSQYNNVLNYAFDAVSVTTSDGLEVIGPDSFSLMGGRRAFWVRTKGKKGVFDVAVKSALGSETLKIEVK